MKRDHSEHFSTSQGWFGIREMRPCVQINYDLKGQVGEINLVCSFCERVLFLHADPAGNQAAPFLWACVSFSVPEALPLLIIIGSSVGGGCVFIVCVITLASICCRHAAKGEVVGQDLDSIHRFVSNTKKQKKAFSMKKKNQNKLNCSFVF